jgi:hypothetical protein
MDREGSSRVLLAGLGVSVVVHAALAMGFVRYAHPAQALAQPLQLERIEIFLPPEEAPQPERSPIRLGIEAGASTATAWLGFADETEHHAPDAMLEQSAMVLAEPLPPGSGPEIERPSQAELAPASEAGQSEAVSQNEPSIALAPGALAERVSEALLQVIRDAATLARDALVELPDLRPPHTAPNEVMNQAPAGPPVEPAPSVTSRHRDAQTTEPPPAAPPHTASSGAAPSPDGIVTDRESLAASIRKAPIVRPGRILAAEGIEIQTRAPRWSYTTLATRRPRNPSVEIAFGRDGRVRRAAFVRDEHGRIYNTGFEDVDQPLLNVIYTWTARGRGIDQLQDDEDEVRIILNVILAG